MFAGHRAKRFLALSNPVSASRTMKCHAGPQGHIYWFLLARQKCPGTILVKVFSLEEDAARSMAGAGRPVPAVRRRFIGSGVAGGVNGALALRNAQFHSDTALVELASSSRQRLAWQDGLHAIR